jgi:hypothetical protein
VAELTAAERKAESNLALIASLKADEANPIEASPKPEKTYEQKVLGRLTLIAWFTGILAGVTVLSILLSLFIPAFFAF